MVNHRSIGASLLKSLISRIKQMKISLHRFKNVLYLSHDLIISFPWTVPFCFFFHGFDSRIFWRQWTQPSWQYEQIISITSDHPKSPEIDFMPFYGKKVLFVSIAVVGIILIVLNEYQHVVFWFTLVLGDDRFWWTYTTWKKNYFINNSIIQIDIWIRFL